VRRVPADAGAPAQRRERAGHRLRRPPDEGRMTAKFKVLIADDSLFMRAAIKKVLERDGRLEVIGEAKDGRDAVEKVARLRPDVCTMDFNMPHLNGAGAVREIMRLRPTPVVMLSPHTREI